VVIGGGGFLGRHIVDDLEAKHVDVVIFDVRAPSPARETRTTPGKTEVVLGDLCKLDDLLKVSYHVGGCLE